MENSSDYRLECVRIRENEVRLILSWRNDPETLLGSYHSQPKTWDTFYANFFRNYCCFPDLPPLFLLQGEQRVAFLYFSPSVDPNSATRKCCEISLIVAPEHRGRGIGSIALVEAQDWLKKQGYDAIYAEVKSTNEKSQRAFIKAGFSRLKDGVKFLEESVEAIPIHRYIFHLTKEKKEEPIFIIAEAGSNWRMGSPMRDLTMAKRLIDVAAAAGANAVKFQTFRSNSIYVSNAGSSPSLTKAQISEDMKTLFDDLSMPYEMIPLLAEYSQQKGLEFMSTPFSVEDFKAIDPYVKRHKIASYEIGHVHLIEKAARSGKPTLLSTGAALEEEIAWAVDLYRQNGGKCLILLQCTACYPAMAESLNLRTIPWFKKRFQVAVGLSDHSKDPISAPIAAVALGAKVIEKHFTLNQLLPGPDHAFALTGNELKQMVQAIRLTEKMLGSEVKTIDPSEMELRRFARRGIQATQPIKQGEILKEGHNIAILRPGNQSIGIYPRYIHLLEGKKASRDINLGEGLQKGDWS